MFTGIVTQTAAGSAPATEKDPWPALFALCLGFFMILVDSTIVSVATPAIIEDLHADVNAVVWVTSAYLLAYAVPVLITGRLGDRFGPKQLYLLGLTVFTLASLWCGLTTTIGWLIVARVVQGLGAAMMTPQTMAIITRIFPAERRGRAMALWGATAGVATLVGPILGGLLVDGARLGVDLLHQHPGRASSRFVLAWRLVPTLETHPHRFDWLGVALSGIGMFLLVFGIQEGHQYDWGTITGPITVWRLIIGGLVVLAVFVLLAGPQPQRAAGAARASSATATSRWPTSRITIDGLRHHRDGVPDHALRPAGPRAEPHRARRCCWCRWRSCRSCSRPVVGRLTDTVHPRDHHGHRLRLR